MGRALLQRLTRLLECSREPVVDMDELELEAEVRRKARKDQALMAIIGENPLEQIDWLIEHGFEELIAIQRRIDRENARPFTPGRGQQLASIRQQVVIEWVVTETANETKQLVKKEPLLTYEYIAFSKVIDYWIRS